MKLTFHQWCNAVAAAIIILGVLAILAQLYPAEARASTLFVSEGVEIVTYNCETEPRVCEEANREIEEEDPPTEAERIWLEEYPLYTEQELEHTYVRVPTSKDVPSPTRSNRPIPPSIRSYRPQAQVRSVRRVCSLHHHQPHRTARADRCRGHNPVRTGK